MALENIVATRDTGSHYVDWCAIAAGAVIATAISIILFTFGTAIGLSMVSPYEGEGVSRAAYLATLGLWTLWVILSSFMAGGYVAGRLRRRVGDSNEHESDVRDGAHGVIVWATGVVLAAVLLIAGVTGAAGTAAKIAAPVAASSTSSTSVADYTIDALFRSPAPSRAPDADDLAAERGEVSRLLAYGLTDGTFGADDKAYVARLIANRTGLSRAEAEARIDEVMARAKETADKARRLGIIIGFLTAAALIIAAAGAAWAATLGGRHRDQNTDTRAFWRWA